MKYFILLIGGVFILSCSTKSTHDFKNEKHFKMFTEQSASDTLDYSLSTDYSIERGLRAPNWDSLEHKSPYFHFQLDYKNTNSKTKLYYKIYYQNESYKYNELKADGSYNKSASANFYGSWKDLTYGFKYLGEINKGETIRINDSISIIGNPRGEYKYYGLPRTSGITDAMIKNKIKVIESTPEWYEAIKLKADENNNPLNKQLFIDAIWSINDSLKGGVESLKQQHSYILSKQEEVFKERDYLKKLIVEIENENKNLDWVLNNRVRDFVSRNDSNIALFVNNRFKRNPRVGIYKFMLVVLTESQLEKVPEHIQFIDKVKSEEEGFVNPFYYFEHVWSEKESVFFSDKALKLKLMLNGKNGVYINPNEFRTNEINTANYNSRLGNKSELFKKAHFEQYFHVINYDFELKNVPLIYDVSEEYSQDLYYQNLKKFPIEERVVSHPTISNKPGETVYFDSLKSAIVLENPGNNKIAIAEKQNVGIKSRHGLSYGKFTAKIKFPDLLSSDYVWNGVTCAFWLFSEEMNSWNSRSICESGYRPKGEITSKEKVLKSSYSEIDIEIVKTSKFWPKSSYNGNRLKYEVDEPGSNDELIIGATNWDLACKDPIDFHQGIQVVNYKGKEFHLHRWDDQYQAVTSKYAYPHDKTVGNELFYQIEWKPNEIIWRIGEDMSKMEVIGYMNEEQTTIPDNQMIAVVTQEFHFSEWWPLSPYDQNNIPYPKKPIKGYVYEIMIE